MENKTGVVLMTYGSATTAENVPAYFERIYKGKASSATIADFEARYRAVGRSPLVDVTNAQAVALEEELGGEYVVRAGMRHSAPFIEEAVGACKDAGADRLVGVILSPQFSSFIMDGYRAAFDEAAATHGFHGAAIAAPWPAQGGFIEYLSTETQRALDELKPRYGAVPVIFTTHSLPQRVVENDPAYLSQLSTTIDAVRAKLDPALEWRAAYQSAGHTPEAWLKPDLFDVLKELRAERRKAALIVPIQFLADHLEILYDLDIKAREQCEEIGIAYHRTPLPNTDPRFIRALALVARGALER